MQNQSDYEEKTESEGRTEIQEEFNALMDSIRKSQVERKN